MENADISSNGGCLLGQADHLYQEKSECSDITTEFSIVTCYREGDNYRKRNLLKFIGWCQDKFPRTEIVLIEQSAIKSDFSDYSNVKHYHQPWDGLFNRSWALNAGARLASCDILLLTDCDLLWEPRLVSSAVNRIAAGAKFARVGEYLLDLTEESSQKFGLDSTYSELIPYEGKRALNYSAGVSACSKAALASVGWYDEGFQGWGGEDDEFFDRIRLLQEPGWLSDCHDLGVTHLWHPTTARQNPKHASNVRRILSRKNWTPEQMRSFINLIDQDKLGSLESPYLSFGETMPKVLINSQNPTLFDRCLSFLPAWAKVYKYENVPVGDYFYKILSYAEASWIMNIDEDAFLVDPEALLDLLAYMKENNYGYCGMSEGGSCWHRPRDPEVINPFFFLANLGDLPYPIPPQGVLPRMLQGPPLVTPPAFAIKTQEPEPYYPLFKWLARTTRCLYLNSIDHPDGWSSILLNHKGVPFIYHSWFARSYQKDPGQTARMDQFYQYALKASGKI